MRRNAPGNDAMPSGAGVLHQFVADGVAELSQLEDNIRADDLSTAAELICQAQRVHVLAQRRAFPVAGYLAYALAQLDIKTQLLDGIGGMLPDVLRQIDNDDLLLVASFKNYSTDVIAACESAHSRGVPVVAITDFALSPLKPHARICFELGQCTNTAFRSLVAPLCLAQALVVGVGHRLVAPRRAAPRQASQMIEDQRLISTPARPSEESARVPLGGNARSARVHQ